MAISLVRVASMIDISIDVWVGGHEFSTYELDGVRAQALETRGSGLGTHLKHIVCYPFHHIGSNWSARVAVLDASLGIANTEVQQQSCAL